MVLAIGSLLTITALSFRSGSDKSELNAVKADVGKLMLLPANEEPLLVVVTDKKQVKDVFLSSKVENNDQLLVYSDNHMVIVYRPSIGKIVTVGTVNSDPVLAELAGATATVFNGANDPAKTQGIINQLKNTYPDLTVTDGGKSNRQDFPSTIVIDNSNTKDNLVDAIVQLITGKRGVVPLSETKASTDLQIIVGIDK